VHDIFTMFFLCCWSLLFNFWNVFMNTLFEYNFFLNITWAFCTKILFFFLNMWWKIMSYVFFLQNNFFFNISSIFLQYVYVNAVCNWVSRFNIFETHDSRLGPRFNSALQKLFFWKKIIYLYYICTFWIIL